MDEAAAVSGIEAAVFSRRAERAFDHAGDERQRQSNDIEIAAVDARNPAGGAALDGVGSGLVDGLVGRDVGGDFLLGQGEHGDVRDLGGGFDACQVRRVRLR